MVYRIIATCCLALLVPAVCAGLRRLKTTEQLTKDVQDLQQKLDDRHGEPDEVDRASREESRPRPEHAEHRPDHDGHPGRAAKQQEAAILDRIDELMNQQQVQLEQQGKFSTRSRRRTPTGNDVLRLSAKMEKARSFASDVHKAVHQSLETHGEFSIHNRMGSFQRIVVNQQGVWFECR